MKISRWILVIVLIWAIFEEDCIVYSSENCTHTESLQTVEYVDSCPCNKIEAAISAKRKNCEHHAKLKKCTNSKDFKYHCVINAEGNKNIEVCALGKKANGFCTEYNTIRKIIQDNYHFDCTKHTIPCPISYNSTDAYLYRECYMCTEKTRTTNNVPLIERIPTWAWTIVITSNCCIVIFCTAVAIICCYIRKVQKRRQSIFRNYRYEYSGKTSL